MENQTQKPTGEYEFSVSQKVTGQQICNLLATAFDGGIGYWARLEVHMPKEPDWSWCNEEDRKRWMEVNKCYVASMCGGCIFVIDTEAEYEAEEDKKAGVQSDTKYRFKIEKEDLIKGMQTFATKYPRHFNDFIQENDDAITGDVFVQCCAFGDIVYG